MAEKKQPRKIRYTDHELSVIKNTFSDNDDVIRVIRKLFLQKSWDIIDKNTLIALRKNRELLGIIRKTFLPELDANAPLHQMIDLWMTVDLKEKPVELCELNILSREKLIKYIEQQLSYLESETPEKIKFDSFIKMGVKANIKNTITNIMMRNTLIAHVEQMIQQFILLAGTKEESVEDTKERLYRDSTK